MNNTGLNDTAWSQLFDKYNIQQRIEKDGYFNISAGQIKEFREPRLMAKFDHTINLPELFKKNKLAILPISRGDYVISHFDAYHEFEDCDASITRVSLPSYIQSLDSSDIPSEAIALNCAVSSGIIADFMEDSDIVATVSGRMGSGNFSFYIGDVKNRHTREVNVNNAQIEIDAAYEGIESLALIEAKRDLSEDFLTRQLYYPYRVWSGRVTKPVRPIFLVYSNGIFRLYEYAFRDCRNYSSLELVKQKNYSVEDTTISVVDIERILNNVKIVNEPEIAFPQADKFERVINLCELIKTSGLKHREITQNYAFDSRQTDYYTNAGRYLGLIQKNTDSGTPVYSISESGQKIMNLNYKKRQLEFCRCILEHGVFNKTLKLYLNSGIMPQTSEIVSVMKESHLYKVKSEETFARRASTIKGWLNWIVSLINE